MVLSKCVLTEMSSVFATLIRDPDSYQSVKLPILQNAESASLDADGSIFEDMTKNGVNIFDRMQQERQESNDLIWTRVAIVTLHILAVR